MNNIAPPVEVSGSLATEMIKRSIAEEQAKKQREEAEAEVAMEREAQRAEELQEQIRADVERQQQEQRARKRAMSDATEVPVIEDVPDTTPTESFPKEISWQNVHFRAVKLFHPQKGVFGFTIDMLILTFV